MKTIEEEEDVERCLSVPLLKEDDHESHDRGEDEEGSVYTGIIQQNVSNLESLDYELFESHLFKQDWRARTSGERLVYMLVKWIFTVVIGVFTGSAALCINIAVENIAGNKFLITSKLLHMNQFLWAMVVFTSINIVLVFFASMLCVYIGPAAAGSGIPEVKAYLNGIDAPEILSPYTLVVKVLGSIAAVSAGLIVGKEGPLVHVGSCIAALLGQGGSKKYGLKWKWLRVFKNDRDRRDLVTCGAAAGVASAFRAPLGGVLFACEEVSSWWRNSILLRAFCTTTVVVVVLQMGILMCKEGKCGLFGAGGLILFDVSDVNFSFNFFHLVPILIFGVCGGLFGIIFNWLNCKVCWFYTNFLNKKGRAAKVLVACTVALISSLAIFTIPWFGTCSPCPESALAANECPSSGLSGNFKKFNCPDGQYSDLASLFFTTNDDAIRNLFSIKTAEEYHFSSVIIYSLSIFFLTLMTYGIAVPSGLFIPVILNGAAFGRILGMMMGKMGNLDEGLYAVLGAAAFLGGSMRMTVSLCVILLELTNNLSVLASLMLVVLISKTVGDFINKSIYEMHVKQKGFPFLEGHSEAFMHQLTAKDAVNDGPLITFSKVERVGVILDVLSMRKHNAFPVIDHIHSSGKQVFCGLVLRSHLLRLLKNKHFHATADAEEEVKLSSVDFAKPGSGKGIRLEDIDISLMEREMYIDLYPITNSSPYTVLETMSLAKAFTLFRQLGLRHLCVVSRTPEEEPIVGILTRHDFLPENLLHKYPYLKKNTKAHAGPNFH